MEFDDYEEANFDDEEAMMMEQQMAMEEEAALAMQMEEEAELANLVPTTPANNISLVPTNNLPLPPPTAMFGLAAAGTAVKFSTPTITDFKKTTNTQLEPNSPPRYIMFDIIFNPQLIFFSLSFYIHCEDQAAKRDH